jgi:META domain
LPRSSAFVNQSHLCPAVKSETRRTRSAFASEPAVGDDASLIGVRWIVSGGIEVAGWASVAPTATFADGRVAGSTGCNRFTAEYTLDGQALQIGEVASTRMACVPPADEVERAYLDALGRVARWRVDDGELVLLDGDGAQLLRYRAAAPAEGRAD